MTHKRFADIDLAQLPKPDIIEQPSYDTLKQQCLREFKNRYPEFNADVESDPAYKLIELVAYYELKFRQQINYGGHSIMLAWASGDRLDNIAANFGVERQLIQAADNTTIPYNKAVYEADDKLRQRVQMALEGFSTAGPTGAYLFHAVNAHPAVKDVSVTSPKPGEVLVTVLSEQGDGHASDELLATVSQALNADNVRPMTDWVTVQSAAIIPYRIDASLSLGPGPDSDLIIQTAKDNLQRYTNKQHRLGATISLSGIYAALHIEGVRQVTLACPQTNIDTDESQAVYCQALSVATGNIENNAIQKSH